MDVYESEREAAMVDSDVDTYGDRFLDTDRSIRLYDQLGRPGNDWQAWEYPRRLARLAQK